MALLADGGQQGPPPPAVVVVQEGPAADQALRFGRDVQLKAAAPLVERDRRAIAAIGEDVRPALVTEHQLVGAPRDDLRQESAARGRPRVADGVAGAVRAAVDQPRRRGTARQLRCAGRAQRAPEVALVGDRPRAVRELDQHPGVVHDRPVPGAAHGHQVSDADQRKGAGGGGIRRGRGRGDRRTDHHQAERPANSERAVPRAGRALQCDRRQDAVRPGGQREVERRRRRAGVEVDAEAAALARDGATAGGKLE